MLALNRRVVESLIDLGECTEAVRLAFAAAGAGNSYHGFRRHVGVEGGAFHVTGGGVKLEGAPLAAFKINARVSGALHGVLLLSDANTGRPVALLDSPSLTATRTAAVTVVAADAVGSPSSTSALVIGAGRVGAAVAWALCELERVSELAVYDRDRRRALAVVEGLHPVSCGRARVAAELGSAARDASLIVSATSASAPLLWRDDVRPGTTIVALGADGPGKQELDPQLLVGALVVVDDLEQCATYGELAHARAAGLVSSDAIPAELGEIVAGVRPGRTTEEIVVVDSTGTAIADVAVASRIVAAASARQMGSELHLA